MLRNLIIFGFLTLTISLIGQNTQIITNRVDSIKDFYYSETYNDYDFLNGREYKPYYNPTTSSPLLKSTMGIGTVYSNGVAYKKLTLLYDRNLDELIVMPKKFIAENIYVTLNKVKIDSFSIKYNDKLYHLIHHRSDDELPMGFYEIPYSGKNKLYIKYCTNNLYNNGVLTYYPKTERYLLKDDQYFQFKKKKDLIFIFSENKKQIRKKLRSFHIPFKQLTNYQISQVLQFAESL